MMGWVRNVIRHPRKYWQIWRRFRVPPWQYDRDLRDLKVFARRLSKEKK